MKFNIQLNATGSRTEVAVDEALVMEAQAHHTANPYSSNAKHPLAYLDHKVSAEMGENMPTPRQQIYAQLGLGDKNLRLGEALNGTRLGAANVADGTLTGRLIALPYLFDTVENGMRESDYGIVGLFNKKAAQVDSIANTKFERPILNYERPEGARAMPIAQLASPVNVLLLTLSDNSYKIPGTSIGMKYSDQAAAAVSMPIVQMSLNRQAEVAQVERIEESYLSFLNGNPDFGQAALSAVPGAVVDASALDTAATGGKLTQLAWVKFLFRKSRICRIDTVVTDLKGALAIENREGRPTVQGDNATSKRIDTLESVVNPTWPDKVEVIISQDPNWPAGTIMGFDSRYGYHVVNSTVLSYQAMQRDAIRRSNELRYDSGSVAYRLHDDVWNVLLLK